MVIRRVAIIGCGLIGGKRARALGEHPLVAVADTDIERAKHLSADFPSCNTIESDWRKVVSRADVDVVIVATTNDVLAPATLAAVRAGKHVLVEKPAARNAAELEPVVQAARDANVIVKVGFNHRFHPAIVKAREIFESGALGPMMFVRGRYGQGGRLGMEKEWRGNRTIAGGGEMLDQGVHLIDLSRWFLGEFVDVKGTVARFFWDWDVEDNGFACLTTAGGQIAWLHASCTEWKNLFSLEIYGKVGKLHIEGLGGSYGVERLNYYKMLPQMGPPETTTYEYPGEDRSWHAEWEHFMSCVDEGRQPSGNLDDALAALRVVGALYDHSPGIDGGGRTS
jgi:predicted dehydrogenase